MDFIDATLVLARALDELGIGYFVGGSVASGFHGEPRMTRDVDIVLSMTEAQVPLLAKRLGPDFDVDEEALAEAVRARRSWNIFYLPLSLKFDLFVLGAAPFDQVEFQRRAAAVVKPDGATLVLKTAEDTVLRKLLWFEAGGRTSNTQWRDVVEVLRVSGAQMSAEYLAAWAGRLGLAELLSQALAEAGVPPQL